MKVQLATVLLGAESFKSGNVNDTFRGQVITSAGETKQVIIKDLDPIQLSNELMAYCLAKEVGLPIPDCYLGLVREGILNVNKMPASNDSEHLVFVSVDVKVPNVTYRWHGSNLAGKEALFKEIIQWGNLGHLYAYDAWIANLDRHPGNLLFGGKSEVWLIDHGHSFTGPIWKPSDLEPNSKYPSRLSEWLTPSLTRDEKRQHAKKARELANSIAGFDASEASKNSRISMLLPLDYVSAMRTFAEQRVEDVNKEASLALGVPALL